MKRRNPSTISASKNRWREMKEAGERKKKINRSNRNDNVKNCFEATLAEKRRERREIINHRK